jgi:hypothetical protein
VGRLVESSVGAHLLNHSISERYDFYYWREGNNEVDFILKKGDKVIGLEVKSEPMQIMQGWGYLMRDFILIKCYWSVQGEFLMRIS